MIWASSVMTDGIKIVVVTVRWGVGGQWEEPVALPLTSATKNIALVSILCLCFKDEEERKRKRMCLRFKTLGVYPIREVLSPDLSSLSS